jgi:hypothetical protein
MVLIFSNNDDLSTTDVMAWLDHYGCNTVRFNDTEFLKSVEFEMCIEKGEKTFFKHIHKQFSINDITSAWYRRSAPLIPPNINNKININAQNVLRNQMFQELRYCRDAMYNFMEDKNWVGNPFMGNIDKIKCLLEAKKNRIKSALYHYN